MNTSPSCPFPAGSVVYSYLRHSPGDNQTIDSQEAAVREWCVQHQVNLIRLFKDEARTGSTTAGRDQFIAMIDTLRDAALTPKPVGVVLWSFSRFARDYDDAEFYKADLRRRGYIIHTLTDQIPDGPFGRVIESITHWKDEERLREISKDAQRGLQWLAQQGYSVGGFPPRGYKKSAPVQVGQKKNGEPRLAHKWEIDAEYEERVRKAWQMKLAGELNWTIHHTTKIFISINCYTSFFSNLTYAGYRKCADLVVPSAHPAYISKVEYDQIQARRQPARKGQVRGGAHGHPRRRALDNPYWLSGVLHCGYCGGAIIGKRNGQSEGFYACGIKKQHGHEACAQPSIVAYAVHTAVSDWLTHDVITMKHLMAARQKLNAQLSQRQGELQVRQGLLREEFTQVERKISNLLNAIEGAGLTKEIEVRLQERRAEKARIETELSQFERALQLQNIEVSEEALHYVAVHLQEELEHGSPEVVRGVVQKIVKRAELYQERLVLHYVPPLLGVNADSKSVLWSVPPREFESRFWP